MIQYKTQQDVPYCKKSPLFDLQTQNSTLILIV